MTLTKAQVDRLYPGSGAYQSRPPWAEDERYQDTGISSPFHQNDGTRWVPGDWSPEDYAHFQIPGNPGQKRGQWKRLDLVEKKWKLGDGWVTVYRPNWQAYTGPPLEWFVEQRPEFRELAILVPPKFPPRFMAYDKSKYRFHTFAEWWEWAKKQLEEVASQDDVRTDLEKALARVAELEHLVATLTAELEEARD